MAILSAALSAKPFRVFKPVPTAVPPVTNTERHLFHSHIFNTEPIKTDDSYKCAATKQENLQYNRFNWIPVDYCKQIIAHYSNMITLLSLFWSPFNSEDNFSLVKRGRNHMMNMLKVRRGCTVTSLLTWPSTRKSDGTEKSMLTGSVNGCSVLPQTQLVGTHLGVDTTQISYVGDFPPHGSIRREARG